MPEEPKPAPTSFRELLQSLPVPAPIVDPKADNGIFRETFVCMSLDEEDGPAFRAFGKTLASVATNMWSPWGGKCSPSETKALELGAVLADLRVLQGFLEMVGESEEPFTVTEEDPDWNRASYWQRFDRHLATKIASLAEEIEKALEAGLQLREGVQETDE
jgi:hypothetical protein